MSRLLRGALALVLACAPQARGDEAVAFSARVLPVLERNCFVCHSPDDDQGGLSLLPDAWEKLVNVPSRQVGMKLVEPGSPEKSYLFLKLLGTHEEAGGKGRIMPIEQDALDPADIEAVRQWILQGAKND